MKMSINKDTTLSIILGLLLGTFLIVLAISGYKSLVDAFIIPTLLIFVLVYGLINKEKYRSKPNRWHCLLFSFCWPGLGQAIYARQWRKFIILLTITIWLPLLVIIFLPFLVTGFVNALFLLLSILIAIVVQIWNLFDAYKIGKKVETETLK